MLGLILIGSVLLVGAPTAADLEAYEQKRAEVGRDAEAHVRLAKWCGEHGMDAERLKHLGLALALDRKNVEARRLLELDNADAAKADAEEEPAADAASDRMARALDEYEDQRKQSPLTAEARWKLAVWCEQHGLKDQARTHFIEVIRLDPSRAAAWKRLGYRKQGKRWVSETQLAAEKAEADAQGKADRYWKPQLERWRSWLGKKEKRDEAERLFNGVADPRAVPSIWKVFGGVRSSTADQMRGVQLLGQIEASASSRALATLAIFGKTEEVRRRAVEVLRHRDPHDFAALLIATLRDPIKYEVKPVNGPGSPGALFVSGERFNVQRLYAAPSLAATSSMLYNGYVYRPTLAMDFGDHPQAAGLPSGAIPVGPLPNGVEAYVVDDTGVTLRRSTPHSMMPPSIPAAFGGPSPQASTIQASKAPDPGANYHGPTRTFVSGNGRYASIVTVPVLPYNPLSTAATPTQQPATSSIPAGVPSQLASLVGSDQFIQQYRQMQVAAFQAEMNRQWTILQAQRMALSAQQQLQFDVATIERYNGEARTLSDRITLALRGAIGEDHGPDRESWSKWWDSQSGKAYVPPGPRIKPTFVQSAPMAYVPTVGPPILYKGQTYAGSPGCVILTHHVRFGHDNWWATPDACFAPGTAVATPDGPRPIEQLGAGDLVLSLDGATGAEIARPIVAVHRHVPTPTWRLVLDGDLIVTTATHPFARSDGRWALARDLVPGSLVATREGASRVEAAGPGDLRPVFNLEVAGGHAYCVGRRGALVHDDSPEGLVP